MCGISGIFHYEENQPADAAVLARMRTVMRHRGPDDHGEYVNGPVGLAFNRLSIIDLAGGHQPMSNEDGSIHVVFNGEIYNFEELRVDLMNRGHRFATRSDTEVIVHGWEEFGERCVEKLRGMFAFVIWDERQRVLFGARDRLGIKPFYYHDGKGAFVFASEMKSLLEVPHVPRDIDQSSLGEFLSHRYVIAPHTMLRGIRKLPPAHTIRVDRAGVQVNRYWDAPLEPEQNAVEATKLEEWNALFKETVRLHLISDVPLGAFLSGGLDSSCIVGLMSRLGAGNIKTFSVGYDSPESELAYAKVVARRFQTDHHELILTPRAFRDFLPRMVWSMDEPVGDEASIPLYYLAQFARQKVTVALSGEGSDEIFGGYPIYRTMLALNSINRLPMAGLAGNVLSHVLGEGKVRKYASMLGQPLETRYGGVSRVFSPDQIRRIFPYSAKNGGPYAGAADAYQRCKNACPLSRMMYVDLNTWLADDLLTKADRMSMANSLELRVPFLDHKIVEFAARLPVSMKVRGGTGKYLLKKWAEGVLPAEIVHRPKKGFPVPTKTWFRTELSSFARETLLASNGPAKTYFSRKELLSLFDSHRNQDRSGQIYSLLVFDQWHRQFIPTMAQ